MTKTISFAAVHFTVALTVGWILSGDLLVGGLIAVVEPVVNTVAYHLHERAWAGRAGGGASKLRPAVTRSWSAGMLHRG